MLTVSELYVFCRQRRSHIWSSTGSIVGGHEIWPCDCPGSCSLLRTSIPFVDLVLKVLHMCRLWRLTRKFCNSKYILMQVALNFVYTSYRILTLLCHFEHFFFSSSSLVLPKRSSTYSNIHFIKSSTFLSLMNKFFVGGEFDPSQFSLAECLTQFE